MEQNDYNRFVEYFSREIERSCVEANYHFSLLEIEGLSGRSNAGALHLHLRACLDAVSRASRILFPAGWRDDRHAQRRSVQRGNELRRLFSVPDDAYIANRHLRDHESHFDERLDRWFEESENLTFGRGMIGSIRAAENLGIETTDILGMYDPEARAVYFGKDMLYVEGVVHELRQIVVQIRMMRLKPRGEGEVPQSS